MLFPSYKLESQNLKQNYNYVAGCDEVGVGPVAGPVVAAACILNPETIGKSRSKSKWYYRVRDSKTVSEKEREALSVDIFNNCLAYGFGEVSPETIDLINIHEAKLLAARLAVQHMLASLSGGAGTKVLLLMDGVFQIPGIESKKFIVDQRTLIGGDSRVLSISAASIIAKVYRDRIMKNYDVDMPDYGFAKHKGYNTKEHRQALDKFGITFVHRKSFLRSIK